MRSKVKKTLCAYIYIYILNIYIIHISTYIYIYRIYTYKYRHMHYIYIGLFEVATESWPECDLNPGPLNSVQTL